MLLVNVICFVCRDRDLPVVDRDQVHIHSEARGGLEDAGRSSPGPGKEVNNVNGLLSHLMDRKFIARRRKRKAVIMHDALAIQMAQVIEQRITALGVALARVIFHRASFPFFTCPPTSL
jgi:hypothetical protein